MQILHCREVPLISIESGRGIIILSMILLYCNFIHHGLLKVASDLLWICAGKRFPYKDQMNVTEDLTSTEWKHFVGKNEIVRESRSSLKKTLCSTYCKTTEYISKSKKRFLCCDSLAVSVGQLDSHNTQAKVPPQAFCNLIKFCDICGYHRGSVTISQLLTIPTDKPACSIQTKNFCFPCWSRAGYRDGNSCYYWDKTKRGKNGTYILVKQ